VRPLELQPEGTTCQCVSEHRPPSIQFEHHHIWPKEDGGPTVPENLVYICATCHNNVHCYLRAFTTAGRVLTPDELRPALDQWHYTPHVQGYAYGLAVLGWTRWHTGTL